jgi:hypothetical protein
VEEEDARSQIHDILDEFPQTETSMVCGDWNTRVGELSPKIDDTTIPRRSRDK